MPDNAILSEKKSQIKIENRAPQKQDNCLSQSISSPVEQILFLQKTIGNQAVGRLFKSRPLNSELSIREDHAQAKHRIEQIYIMRRI
jgi:hypothetical protein